MLAPWDSREKMGLLRCRRYLMVPKCPSEKVFIANCTFCSPVLLELKKITCEFEPEEKSAKNTVVMVFNIKFGLTVNFCMLDLERNFSQNFIMKVLNYRFIES